MADKPEAFMEGTFALYWLPDQSLVVAYRRHDAEATEQLVVPGYVVQMASSMGGGMDPMSMLKMLGGGS